MRTAAQVCGVKAPGFVSPMWLAKIGAPFMTLFSQITGQEPIYTSEALHALETPCRLDHSKAKKELGHNPRSLEQSIKDIYQDFDRRQH